MFYIYFALNYLLKSLQLIGEIIHFEHNHMAQWSLFDAVNSVILKFPSISKFPADDFGFHAVVFLF